MRNTLKANFLIEKFICYVLLALIGSWSRLLFFLIVVLWIFLISSLILPVIANSDISTFTKFQPLHSNVSNFCMDVQGQIPFWLCAALFAWLGFSLWLLWTCRDFFTGITTPYGVPPQKMEIANSTNQVDCAVNRLTLKRHFIHRNIIFFLFVFLGVLLQRVMFIGERVYGLNEFMNPDLWHFGWLFLFMGICTFISLSKTKLSQISQLRDELPHQDPLYLYAPRFWVFIAGSRKQVYWSFGLLLFLLLVPGNMARLLLTKDVFDSIGFPAFIDSIMAFRKNHPAVLGDWIIGAFLAWSVALIFCYWTAGDMLGNFGGLQKGFRVTKIEQRRNIGRTWIHIFVLIVFMFTLISISINVVSSFIAGFLEFYFNCVKNDFPRGAYTFAMLAAPFEAIGNFNKLEGVTSFTSFILPKTLLFFLLIAYFKSESLRIDKKSLQIEEPSFSEKGRAPIFNDAIQRLWDSKQFPDGLTIRISPAIEANAYSTGIAKKNRQVIVTKGLLKLLKGSPDALAAVIAHEIGHIKNGDSAATQLTVWFFLVFSKLFFLSWGVLRFLVQAPCRFIIWAFKSISAPLSNSNDTGATRLGVLIVSATIRLGIIISTPLLLLSGAYVGLWIFCLFGALFLLSCISLPGIRLLCSAISVRREFAADAFAVEMTQNPLALIEALEKIHMEVYECPDQQVVFKPLFFADNFKGRSDTINRLQNFLFPSHPKPEDRVKRLYHMIEP